MCTDNPNFGKHTSVCTYIYMEREGECIIVHAAIYRERTKRKINNCAYSELYMYIARAGLHWDMVPLRSYQTPKSILEETKVDL